MYMYIYGWDLTNAKKRSHASPTCTLCSMVRYKSNNTSCPNAALGKENAPWPRTADKYSQSHCALRFHTLKECVGYHTLTKKIVCGALEFSKIAH